MLGIMPVATQGTMVAGIDRVGATLIGYWPKYRVWQAP
jgi:hypothetical protein